jgi:glycerol-3-phosphate acyltransferase PlsY
MIYLLAVTLAYLIGSFPSGVVVVRIARGIDVRRVGSQRSGATNVFRTAGIPSALITFLLDVFKGAGAVWLGVWLAGRAVEASWGLLWPLTPEMVVPLWAGMAAGLAAIAGHNWPIYIRFQGGRGVATSLGTLLPLAPVVGTIGFVVGLLIIIASRYASLGSMVGACCVPTGLIVQALFVPPVPLATILYGSLIAGIIVFQHRDNIARLRTGTERRLGVKPPGDGETKGQGDGETRR